MLDPNVIKARKTVERYKELNKNTVERLIPGKNSKTWYFEKVKIDKNASLFVAEQKNAHKQDTLEIKRKKRGKKPDTIKKENPEKVKPVKQKNTRVYDRPGMSEARKNRIVEMYEMSVAGFKHKEIAEKYGLSHRTVTYELSAYRKAKKLPINCNTRNEVYELIKKGFTITQIAQELKKSRSNISKHIYILQKQYPKLVINRTRLPAKEKGLSAENLAVMDLIEKGYSRAQISEKLNILPNTITHHFHMIKKKAGPEWKGKIEKLDRRNLTKKEKCSQPL